MPHIFSVVNHKGGVGKTTSAVNIAAALGELDQKVLLVDIDPQGSASMFLGEDNDGQALLNALAKTTALPLIANVSQGVDLVPSGPHLVAAHDRFTTAFGKELFARCLQRTEGDWQWVIIDCPPNMGVLTLAALHAGRHVIIPVEANYLALKGLRQVVSFLESLDIPGIEIAALIPCRAQTRRRIHGEIIDHLHHEFPGRVTPIIRENVALAEAPGHGKPVTVYASHSRGAENYRQAAQWLLAHVTSP